MPFDRHIHFIEKSLEKTTNRIETSSSSPSVPRASSKEILSRYLSIFEERFPSFLNEFDRDTLQSNRVRTHHRDALQLHHLHRIQSIIESVDDHRDQLDREDLMLIIDAFDVFLEHQLKADRQTTFIHQCRIEERQNQTEMTLSISHFGVFHQILLTLNRLCHSPSIRFEAHQLAEIFRDFFPSLSNSSCERSLEFLITHYHRVNFTPVLTSALKSFNQASSSLSSVGNHHYFIVLDALMKSIEEAASSANIDLYRSKSERNESAKQLLATLLHQSRRFDRCEVPAHSTVQQRLEAFRMIFKTLFPYSSLKMISSIEDRERYLDVKIAKVHFDFVMIFLGHLHRMSTYCPKKEDRSAMIDYFSSILFGESTENHFSSRIKDIFRTSIEQWNELI